MSYFDLYRIKDLSNLELLAKQVVEGFIIGLHKSPYHGFSVEFAEHRIYNPGESTKNIDWKVFGRTDRLYTKKYEEETNLRCQLVLDVSSSMYFPELHVRERTGKNKLGFSALAAASIMNLLKKQRDAYGLSLYAQDIHTHTEVKSSSRHDQRLLSLLENQLSEPELLKGTKTSHILHQIAERIHRRSLVIIFSDLLNDEESGELISALQHLKHNKHEVIIFRVMDEAHEVELAYEDRPHLFEDLETGRTVRLNPNEVRPAYVEAMKKEHTGLKLACLQHHIDFVEADINKGFRSVLNHFLIRRHKMNI